MCNSWSGRYLMPLDIATGLLLTTINSRQCTIVDIPTFPLANYLTHLPATYTTRQMR
jgi:hypothetical protein